MLRTKKAWFWSAGIVALLLLLPALALAQSTATVSTATDAKLGSILVGPNGLTLYVSKNDRSGVSNCSAQCQAVWPPLTSTTAPTAGTGVTGTLSLISGTSQVTYNGAPLYYWKSDVKAGDTTGQGVGPFSVALVSTQASTQAASPSGSPAAPKTGNAGLLTSDTGASVAVLLLLAIATVFVVRRSVPRHSR